MDDLLEQFLVESREQVQQLAEGLLDMERGGADAGRIDAAFRAVHTLKGSVGLFDLAPMGQVLHAAEDLLGAVRDGHLEAGRAVIDTLLDCVALTESWIGEIARSGRLPGDAAAQGRLQEAALREALGGHAAPGRPAGMTPDPGTGWLPACLARAAGAVSSAQEAGLGVAALRYEPAPDCFFLGDDPMALVRSVPGLIALHLEPRAPWRPESFEPFTCNLVIEALSTAPAEDIRQLFRFVGGQAAVVQAIAAPATDGPATREPGHDAARSLRVDAARIDALADLVGELMVAKNGLAHLVARAGGADPALARALAANYGEIDRLAGGLHRAVMGVRMTPLAQTLRRFPRLMRDIAAQLGKDVAFEMRGEEVEADKSVVDGLFEPLLHLLRNAAGHGTEPPEARRAAGKPAGGRITLEARREGDRIEIAVADDGAGIDPAAIRRAAKARRIMPDAAIDALDDEAALELIFAPGFSTAAIVTAISGRGVGMDAVRKAVEGLGGRVGLTSVPGVGCTVRLSLPRAVVVTTVMTLRVGAERFGVPIEAVAETARIPADRILPVRGGEAFVLRDATIPLLRLATLLDLPASPRGSAPRVLIAAIGGQRIGVEVDGFAERMDVLLRPMSGLLSGVPGALGTALTGDGRVLLVLDLPALLA